MHCLLLSAFLHFNLVSVAFSYNTFLLCFTTSAALTYTIYSYLYSEDLYIGVYSYIICLILLLHFIYLHLHI